jgi:anthranilate phosphoribosyltransferase
MRALAAPVSSSRPDLVDTAGTGGGPSTFNVSTTAALVAAGAGCAVAKHGNRSNTSRCGSADLLEALGVNVDLEPEEVGRCIDEVGFGFMFAPRHHAAMAHVVPVRKALGVRTIFNFLGPLTNPAAANRQLLGVADRHYQETIAEALVGLGSVRAMVVAAEDGLDELSLASHPGDRGGRRPHLGVVRRARPGRPRSGGAGCRGGGDAGGERRRHAGGAGG